MSSWMMEHEQTPFLEAPFLRRSFHFTSCLERHPKISHKLPKHHEQELCLSSVGFSSGVFACSV